MATSISSRPDLVTATAVGISLSAFFTGGNFALSHIAFPGLLLARPDARSSQAKPETGSQQLSRQWRLVFTRGLFTLPWAAVVSSACFGYVAWNLPATASDTFLDNRSVQNARRAFITAASFAFSIGPWTFAAMSGVNGELQKRATHADKGEDLPAIEKYEAKQAVQEMDVEALMRQWAYLNLIRAALPFAAILSAVAGTLF